VAYARSLAAAAARSAALYRRGGREFRGSFPSRKGCGSPRPRCFTNATTPIAEFETRNMPSPRILPLPAAAAELEVRPDTLRFWIRRGAPCVRQGGRGPGKGALVDPDRVRAWRDRGADNAPLVRLDEVGVARGLAATYRACSGLGITQRQAAMVLALAFEEIVRGVTGHPPAELPEETRWLIAIALGSRDVKP